MKLNIVQGPDQVLSAIAKPIQKIDSALLQLIEQMKETLVSASDPEGIGLAAPQVGKSLQLFIIKESKDAPWFIFINPKVELIREIKKPTKSKKNPSVNSGREKNKDERLEGCLSLKDIWGTVVRAPKVKISYLDEKGAKHTDEVYDKFFATIIQHEYDHLQGMLFPKRVLEQHGKLYKSHKDEKGEEVFDLIEL